MEKDDGDLSELWNDLALYGEEASELAPTLPSEREMQAPLPLGDRFVGLYLSGFLPVLLLCLGAAVLCGGTDPRFMTLGVLVSPLLAWPLSRLVRGHDGVSVQKLVLYLGPILVLNCLFGLSSACLFHSARGNPIHLEQLAWSFQGVLESCLGWPLIVYLGFSLGLIALIPGAKHQYPWLDNPQFKTRDRYWTVYPALVVLLLFTLAFIFALTPSKTAAEWRQRASQVFKDRPFGGVPAESRELTWTDRAKDLQHRIDVAAGDLYYTKPEERRRALAGVKLELDFESELPTSRREIRAALNYLAGAKDGSEPPEDCLLKQVKLGLMAAPIHAEIDHSDFILYLLLPTLAQSQQDIAGLQRLLQDLEESKRTLLPPMAHLDQGAHWLLWVRPDALHHGDSKVGWKASGWRASRMRHISWVYRGAPKPKDLEILGFSTTWSPTHLLARMKRWELAAEWLETRSELETMDPSEWQGHIKSKVEGELSVNLLFWSQMASYATGKQTEQALETAELVVRLKLAKAQTGQFPETLEGLLSNPERHKDYVWDPEGAKLTPKVGPPVVLTSGGAP